MPPSSRGFARKLPNWSLLTRVLLCQRFASTLSPITTGLPAKIVLRPYQEECIQAVLSSLKEGKKRLGISLATGSGKTVIFTQLIDRVKPRNDVANQTLIVAHRQELVEQAAKHCQNAYPGKTVEVEMGSIHASGAADITVASVQSIISGDRISKFNPEGFKLVLVDEAHHIAASGYLRMLAHFGLSKAQPNSPALVGVSATLSRFDGLKLGTAIDHIVYHKDYIDMIGEKWLSDVMFTTVQSKADISTVKKGVHGDFLPSELSSIVNTDAINETTVRSWLAKAEGRKSTLVFCVDLNHVKGLTNTFRKHGIDARIVTGSTPKVERSARLDEFRAGNFPVLVNCAVFTEGTDIPNIDCVVLARPTKSRNLLVQMIGRGMRLHPGKKNCHIIDMVASLETGIVTTPTLFGLNPLEVLDAASVAEVKSVKEEKEASEQAYFASPKPMGGGSIPSIVTFTDYDSVFDLIQDTSQDRHIRGISIYAWVAVDQYKYILTDGKGSYLRVEKVLNEDRDSAQYITTYVMALPRHLSTAPLAKPRVIAQAITFSDAVHAADTFAQHKFLRPFISKSAPWRDAPATTGQLNFLNKLRLKDEQLTPEMITKGKAMDMITKLKHGARGRFANLEADRRRAGRVQLKVEQEKLLKDREQVAVGPLSA